MWPKGCRSNISKIIQYTLYCCPVGNSVAPILAQLVPATPHLKWMSIVRSTPSPFPLEYVACLRQLSKENPKLIFYTLFNPPPPLSTTPALYRSTTPPKKTHDSPVLKSGYSKLIALSLPAGLLITWLKFSSGEQAITKKILNGKSASFPPNTKTPRVKLSGAW